MSTPAFIGAKQRAKSWLQAACRLLMRRPASVAGAPSPRTAGPETRGDATNDPARPPRELTFAGLAARQAPPSKAMAPAPSRVWMDADTLGQGDHRRIYQRDARHANRFYYWPDVFRLKRGSTWPFDPVLTFDREQRLLSLEFEPYTSIDRLKLARARLVDLVPAHLSAVGATLELALISAPGSWWQDPAYPCPLPMPEQAPQIATDKTFVVRWRLPSGQGDRRPVSGVPLVDRYDVELARWLVGPVSPQPAFGQRSARVRVSADASRPDGAAMEVPVLDSLQMASRHMYESTVVQTPGSPLVTVYLHNKAAETLVFRNPCVWLRRAGRRGLEQLTAAPIKPPVGTNGWRLAPMLAQQVNEGGLEIAPGHTLTLSLVPSRPIDGDGPLEAVLDEGFVSCRSERQRVLERLVRTLEVAR